MPFATTEELAPLEALVGQDRAIAALAFGLGLRRKGYNVIAMGPAGVGRHLAIASEASRARASLPPPEDLVYLPRPTEPRRPALCRLPAGQALALREAMKSALAEPAQERTTALGKIAASYEEHAPAVAAHCREVARALAASSVERALEELWARHLPHAFVTHEASASAPILFEDNPTAERLFGYLEARATPGGPMVPLDGIRAGALHQARGGYLVVDAHGITPGVWERLKRILRAGESCVEGAPPGAAVLEPDPIPVDLKVVLATERWLYYQIADSDPELDEHFKVVADFANDLPRTADSELSYGRLLRRIIDDEGLPHFDQAAVARVIEEASRWADDARRLSLDVRRAQDLLVEATHVAGAPRGAVIGREAVEEALAGRSRRRERARKQSLRFIEEGIHLIDTDGRKIGQINGLGVESVGTEEMGLPIRITSQVRAGRGTLVDIEREVELSGPLHSKGVLILGGFLGGRYATDRPLSLHATLVMEQSYGAIDGDSASLAELCVLLCTLAELPIRQDLAVTGSVDQHGRVQAVGAVSSKIEGFFDVCRARGPLAQHGVLIPDSTVQHLMLRPDVVDAAREGSFEVHGVSTVNEALALLTGVTAGERNAYGQFPEGSVNGRVETRLRQLATTELNQDG